jgi:hypothetical protein
MMNEYEFLNGPLSQAKSPSSYYSGAKQARNDRGSKSTTGIRSVKSSKSTNSHLTLNVNFYREKQRLLQEIS